MSRLTPDILKPISTSLKAYDKQLMERTGCDLLGLACLVHDVPRERFVETAQKHRACIVPITCGKGMIHGFSETLVSLCTHLGVAACKTKNTDVAGLAEAYETKASIILMADDICFLAINTSTGIVSDNNSATASGFVTGLDLMSDGIVGKRVLVLGCGEIGTHAVVQILKLRGLPVLFDVKHDAARDLAKCINNDLGRQVEVIDSIEGRIIDYQYIIDATPAPDIISHEDVSVRTYLSCPGVPLGLNRAAVEKLGIRLLHDPLQIGVAVMLVKSLAIG